MVVSVIQSNYLPWRGYFDIIKHSDLFIFYDDVAYSKNTWRNRNTIKTANGPQWLTVPVHAPAGTLIQDVRIADDRWIKKHGKAIELNYRKAPYFEKVWTMLAPMYTAESYPNLSELNQWLTVEICEYLNLEIQMVNSSAYQPQGTGRPRLLDLLHKVGATEYITGPAGLNYFTQKDFDDAGIKLTVWDYSKYRPYKQQYGEFNGNVSVIDTLFNTGELFI